MLKKGEKNPRYGFRYTEEEKEEIRKVSKIKAVEQWNKEGAREKHSQLMKKKLAKFYATEDGKKVKEKQAKEQRKNALKGKNKGLIALPKGVICLEEKTFFPSLSFASNYYNIDKAGICRSCKNKKNSSQSINGRRCHWRYVNYKHNKIYRVNT